MLLESTAANRVWGWSGNRACLRAGSGTGGRRRRRHGPQRGAAPACPKERAVPAGPPASATPLRLLVGMLGTGLPPSPSPRPTAHSIV
jgi:hypothetical protein